MAQIIIYVKASGGMMYVQRVNQSLSWAQVAAKAVPSGIDYWVVDESELPTDSTFRDSWVIDVPSQGAPTGQGGGEQHDNN
ncbi:MAG: hypothetical protein DRI24_19450 [Deltaproteobacteria bacterium]|nr:MAG: hypothetical protein DRI24_19450 [Deltaproteobacteria bacterium]